MKLRVRRAKAYVTAHWKWLSLLAIAVVALGGLLYWQLGSLAPLSSAEQANGLFYSSWRHLATQPLGIILTAPAWLIETVVSHHGNTVTRAASPLLGGLTLICFAYVLRRWYGVRSAVFGTVLFGCSSWFLHVSRFAGPEVLYLATLPLLWAATIVWERHRSVLTTYGLGIVLMLVAYTPGGVWFIALSLGLQPHLLKHGFTALKNLYLRLGLILVELLLLAPLVIAGIKRHTVFLNWLGLPDQLPHPAHVLRGLMHSVSYFVYRGPYEPTLWMERVAILSFLGTVMAILGVMFYAKHIQAPRTRLLLASFVVGAVLFALGGPVGLSTVVPVVYLIVAAGVGYLLHTWLQVFPKNPLARSVGFGLLAVVIGLACVYNLRAYFVAWPHDPVSRAAQIQQR